MSSPRLAALPLAALLALGGLRTAAAETSDPSGTMSFEVDLERNTRQRVLIASLAGGALALGGVGLLFHLDSRDKSDAISASGSHTGLIYSREVDDVRRSALRSRKLAIVSYGLGIGMLAGTLVAFVMTDPGRETIVVGGEPATPELSLEVAEGGAVVGRSWSF
jgi:hypothetical protein